MRQPLEASQRERIAAGLPFVESHPPRLPASMPPSIDLAGLIAYAVVSSLGAECGAWLVPVRFTIVPLVGGFFMYYGLKAVHLTEVANRVWKRSAEYGLILGERRRLEARRRSTDIG